MKAVILCGGQGTRFREVTYDRPKPMIEIGGRPILWHVMQIFSYHDVKDFLLCLGYRGDVIKQYFLNYRYTTSDFTVSLKDHETKFLDGQTDDWQVTLLDTGASTMTGGRISRALPSVGDETFFVTYGDGVANIDIRRLLEFHRSHGLVATVTAVRVPSTFGLLDVDSDYRVTEFREKPMVENFVNGGFFVFEPGIATYLGDDTCVLEREPLHRLVKDGQLAAYVHDGYWQCMDHRADFMKLDELARSGPAPWAMWDQG
jgi:glucose-1-phosphate cytidylyltransferase